MKHLVKPSLITFTLLLVFGLLWSIPTQALGSTADLSN